MSTGQSLAAEFLHRHPSDAADLLTNLAPDDALRILEHVEAADSATVLTFMAPAAAARCISMMSTPRAAAVLEYLPPRVGAALIRFTDHSALRRILGGMKFVKRSRLEAQLQYPPSSVGASMDAGFPAVQSHWAIGQLREVQAHWEGIPPSYVYVVDEHSTLVGVLDLKNLDAPDDAHIKDVMIFPVQSLYAFTPLEAVLDHPGWTAHDRLPVVSTGGVLAGTLRHRDLRRQPPGVEAAGGGPPVADALMTISELYWGSLWSAIDGFAAAESPETKRRERSERR